MKRLLAITLSLAMIPALISCVMDTTYNFGSFHIL